jgi:endonuclease G
VFYKLTQKDLVGTKVPRTGSFKSDTLVGTGSAHPNDYKYTGYDRGHLKPSGDEPIDRVQMKETYYMSNISPQHPSFNRGMWKRLESYVRIVTLVSDSVYIVTGGILSDSLNTLNTTDICIPKYYFKVVHQFLRGKMTTYCYLMPNKKLNGKIEDYLVPISKVEALTKLKFLIKIE